MGTICTLLAMLLFPNNCLGRLYWPESYAILSSDQTALLVMRSPVDEKTDLGRKFKLPSGLELDLRSDFHSNGVFRLADRACVRSLDWFADDGELFASGDFKLLVRLNRFAVENQTRADRNWCLKFYNDGKEVKRYRLGDLVGIPRAQFLPYTSDGWHSVWYATAKYSGSSEFINTEPSHSSLNQFILVTAPQMIGPIPLTEGNVFLFNANNGAIVQERRRHPLAMAVFLVAALISVVAFGVWTVYRSVRK
jgi:hypothetical protein